MTRFSLPRVTADRLSRLPLACADEVGPLGHIGIRVTREVARSDAERQLHLDAHALPQPLAAAAA